MIRENIFIYSHVYRRDASCPSSLHVILLVNVSSELVLFDDILPLGLLDSCGNVERSQHVKLILRHFATA